MTWNNHPLASPPDNRMIPLLTPILTSSGEQLPRTRLLPYNRTPRRPLDGSILSPLASLQSQLQVEPSSAIRCQYFLPDSLHAGRPQDYTTLRTPIPPTYTHDNNPTACNASAQVLRDYLTSWAMFTECCTTVPWLIAWVPHLGLCFFLRLRAIITQQRVMSI